MIFFAIPTLSEEKPYDENQMHSLRNMLVEQLEDLSVLCTVIEYLNGFKEHGIDQADAQKYEEKITNFEQRQQNRFETIDTYITENVIAVKKQQTENKTISTSGKEVRKLEAGLRTLKLFTIDIISMLKPNSTSINRVEDRLYYFYKRSAALEAEIKVLQENLSYL